jgi:hypothetical protein
VTTDDLEAFGMVMALLNETFGDPYKEVSDLKCDWNVGERQWKRKEFLATYQAYLVQGSYGPHRCIGEFERINVLTGHRDRIAEPIAIGSAEDRPRPAPRRALKW